MHPSIKEFAEWLETKGADQDLDEQHMRDLAKVKDPPDDLGDFPFSAKGNCEMMAAMHDRAGQGGAEKSVETFLLRYGEEFEGTPRPEWVQQMTPKMCFMNCFLLVEEQRQGNWLEERPELTYCEGYVLQSGLPIPIHHAWCVTPEGQVIDPTLPHRAEETASYFGVRIPFDALEEIVAETGTYSALFKRQGHAIIERVCSPKGDSDADGRN